MARASARRSPSSRRWASESARSSSAQSSQGAWRAAQPARPLRFRGDGAARRHRSPRPAEHAVPQACAVPPAAAARWTAGAAALHARQPHARPRLRAAARALGAAEAALRRRLQTEGICFICPKVKLEIGRDATLADRPLGVDRARLQDPRPRGRGEHRGQDRDRPGVHHLRLPARLDRPRVHHRRQGHADRLRPRRHRGRAAGPPAGHLQARCDASATTSGSAMAPASCAGSSVGENCDRRHQLGGDTRVSRQRGARGRPGAGDPDAQGARARCAGGRLERA